MRSLAKGGIVAGLLATAGGAAHATPDLPQPVLFAPDVISAGENDGAPTFSPDGRTLYFERTNSKTTIILESHRRASGWSRPVVASFSGTYPDQQPTLAPDGRYLVYVSTRVGDDAKRVSHLYRVNRIATGWSAPIELPATVNISVRVFKPSVAANGDLYFMSDVGPGGAPKWRLFRSVRRGAEYAPAEFLPFSGPDDADVDPYIASDQSYIIFSSANRPPQRDGHEHLYITERRGDRWGPVRPLRYVGDTWGADDGEAQVAPDGKRLYFTSSRIVPLAPGHGRADIVAYRRTMETWNNSNSNIWSISLMINPAMSG